MLRISLTRDRIALTGVSEIRSHLGEIRKIQKFYRKSVGPMMLKYEKKRIFFGDEQIMFDSDSYRFIPNCFDQLFTKRENYE